MRMCYRGKPTRERIKIEKVIVAVTSPTGLVGGKLMHQLDRTICRRKYKRKKR